MLKRILVDAGQVDMILQTHLSGAFSMSWIISKPRFTFHAITISLEQRKVLKE
jgi:hypothetical protein